MAATLRGRRGMLRLRTSALLKSRPLRGRRIPSSGGKVGSSMVVAVVGVGYGVLACGNDVLRVWDRGVDSQVSLRGTA